MTAAILATELFLMICIGYFMEKGHIVGESFHKDLASFITNITLPCLIVQSMQVPFSMGELKKCGCLLLLAMGFLTVSFCVAWLAWIFGHKDHRARLFRFGLIFPNFTFMGIPVMQALYGETGVFHYVVFLVPLRIALYSTAKTLLSPRPLSVKNQPFGRRLKAVLSPPLVAVPVGLFFYVTGWQFPAFLQTIIGWLASVTSPLGMILCGLILGRYPLRTLLQKKCFLLVFLRCLFMPGLFWSLCALLGLNQALAQSAVLCAAMPVASITVTYTLRYDPDPDAQFESAGSVLLSTLLSAATIPLWVYLLTFL